MRETQSPSYAYIESQISPENNEKIQARNYSKELGLDMISVSPTEAHLMRFISQIIRPKKIVEIGTLTGLSSLYFLESLTADGKLWTFEKSPEHAKLARQSLASYIKNGQCEVVVGDAEEMLSTITNQGPFDVVFLDGNKASYYTYWQWAKANLRSGGLILIDNAFLSGSVWGDNSKQMFNDKQISSVKKMTSEIFSTPGFSASFAPTNEGLLIVRKD